LNDKHNFLKNINKNGIKAIENTNDNVVNDINVINDKETTKELTELQLKINNLQEKLQKKINNKSLINQSEYTRVLQEINELKEIVYIKTNSLNPYHIFSFS